MVFVAIMPTTLFWNYNYILIILTLTCDWVPQTLLGTWGTLRHYIGGPPKPGAA